MYLWTVKKQQQQIEEAEDGIISSFIDFEKKNEINVQHLNPTIIIGKDS